MNNEYASLADRINKLEERIKTVEGSADLFGRVSAVELMRLKDELSELKLKIQWRIMQDDRQARQGTGAPMRQTQPQPPSGQSAPSDTPYVYGNPVRTAAAQPDSVQPAHVQPAPVQPTYKAPACTSAESPSTLDTAVNAITSRITEIGVGKVVLSLVAALLIILAAGTFVRAFWGSFWESVPDIVKALLLIFAGLAAGTLGVVLYEKKKLYPFIILYAAGSAVSYIGIVAANIVYGAIGLYPSIALILAWTAVNLVCYLRYHKVTMLVVTSLGIVVSSFLISSIALDTALDTEVFPIVYTVVAVIMALMPIAAQLVPKIRARLSGLYAPITFGTALLSIGVCFGYALSAVNRYGWISEEGRSFLMTAEGAVTASAVCLAILVLLAAVIYKANLSIKDRTARGIISVFEIQAVLAMTVAFAAECVTSKQSFAEPLVYLAAVGCILLGGLLYGGSYRFVAFNLAAGLAWLIEEASTGMDVRIEATLYILAALAVYAVYVFIVPRLVSCDFRREKLLSLLPLLVTLFVMGIDGNGRLDDINGLWMLLVLCATAALALIGYGTYKVLKDKTEDFYYSVHLFVKPLIDVFSVIFINAVFDGYIALAVSAAYLAFARILVYKNAELVYKLVYSALAVVFSLVLMESRFGIEGARDPFLYTLSSFAMIGIFLSIAFAKDTNAVGRVLAVVFSAIMIPIYIDGMTESSTLAILSVIIAASVLLTAGFVRNHRSVRITSLSVLLLGVLALIVSLSDFTDSMATVGALLGSGVFVLVTSIVYSMLERKMSEKNEE